MDEVARARADAAAARRAKILARQKDRLTQITGSYSGVAQGSEELSSAQQQPIQCSDDVTPASSHSLQAAAAPEPSGMNTKRIVSDDQEQQQMAALMAAMDSLQRAQARMQQTSEPSSDQWQQRQQTPGLPSQLLGYQAAAPSTIATAPLQGELPKDTEEEQQQQQQRQQAPLLLQLGPQVSVAVKHTQAIRLLSAVLLAYAALSGWQLGIPAALVLFITDLSIVLAAVLFLYSSAAGKKLLAATQQQEAAAAGVDVQMPMRLRRFDFFTLVPGLRELLTALSGYQQLANAVSEDTAAYLLTLGLLTVALALQPSLVKV